MVRKVQVLYYLYPVVEKKYYDKTSNYTDCDIYHSEHGHGASYQTYTLLSHIHMFCIV